MFLFWSVMAVVAIFQDSGQKTKFLCYSVANRHKLLIFVSVLGFRVHRIQRRQNQLWEFNYCITLTDKYFSIFF